MRTRYYTIIFITFLFHINAVIAQSITVLSPNGGETLTHGTNFIINWTSSGVTNVSIDYSINGGVNWVTIATNVTTPGSYSWSIPNLPTTQALIRIRKNTTSDVSNSFFFIKSPQFNSNDTIKILPIGDSITFDSFRAEFRFVQNKISYRSVLWDSLRTNNYNFDFIGHKVAGYYHFPDPNNNGIPGITDDQMAAFLQSGYDPNSQMQVTPGNYLNYFTPNVVLIHIGTNGVDEVGGTSALDIQNILNLIDAKSPNIWVVLALIINKAPTSPNVTTFNDSVQSIARARINSGDKIIIVNMQSDAGMIYTLDTAPPFNGDMYDVKHPNDSGKEKMARLWFKALKLILPNSTKSSPNIISLPDTTGYVGFPYKYDVNATGIGAPNYLLLNSPAGMRINSKTGIIEWNPTSTGSYPVSVKALNSSGENIQDFTITVLLQQPLTNNLISYWRMDEIGSPKTLKDFPGINDAYVINSVSTSQGIVNNALNLNGSTRVDVLDDSSLYFYPSESFSIEMWVKTTQSGGSEKIFLGKNGGSTKFTIGINSLNQTKFETRDSTDAITNVIGPSINDGNWHHVAGVLERENNRLSIFIDGIRTSTAKTFHTSGFFSYDPMTLGYFEYGNYFKGQIDEVAIYNRSLTQAEVTDHYNRGIFFKRGYFDQFVLTNIKVFLEGFYYPNGDSMSTKLRVGNFIPLTSPYTQDPRTVDSIPANIVDWILIELRSNASEPAVAAKSVFLHKNGNLVADDGITPIILLDAPLGNYYIVIKHRNTIETWSSSKQTFTSAALNYNFPADSSKVYGFNMKKIGTSWCFYTGDANLDGVVDLSDMGIVETDNLNFASGYIHTDLNGDNLVDISDITLTDINNLNYVSKVVPTLASAKNGRNQVSNSDMLVKE